jgi:hypothetical protein
MERAMTQTHDYNEMVDLIATVRPAQGPNDVNTSGKVATLPLREAVRTVIEDWDGDKWLQLSAFIARQSGPPLRTLEEIRALYNQLKASATL